MTADKIIELLDILIGKSNPTGETNEDIIRQDNLKKLCEITEWCLDGVVWSAEHYHDQEYSCAENGKYAMKKLREYLDIIYEGIKENE